MRKTKHQRMMDRAQSIVETMIKDAMRSEPTQDYVYILIEKAGMLRDEKELERLFTNEEYDIRIAIADILDAHIGISMEDDDYRPYKGVDVVCEQ